jgi:hypothetical protein
MATLIPATHVELLAALNEAAMTCGPTGETSSAQADKDASAANSRPLEGLYRMMNIMFKGETTDGLGLRNHGSFMLSATPGAAVATNDG